MNDTYLQYIVNKTVCYKMSAITLLLLKTARRNDKILV